MYGGDLIRINPHAPLQRDDRDKVPRSASMKRKFDTVEEFYAHALAIEREASERYGEFAEHFERRGEPVLAGLCRNLASAEREHYENLKVACKSLSLPALAANEYVWLEGDAPESAARDAVYSVAEPRALLELALKAEVRARDFFVWVARTATSKAVKELAAIMAAEELDHVAWVRQALEYHGGRNDWDALLKPGSGSFSS